MLPAQPNKSLIGGIELLLALVSRSDAVGVRQLARELDMDASRVQRLLGTLAHLGLARQEADRRYSVGPGVHLLAAMSLGSSRLLQAVLPAMNELCHWSGRVAVGVLWRAEVCYLVHADTARPLAEGLGQTRSSPALKSSIGRVLLACEGADYRRQFLSPDALCEVGWSLDEAEVEMERISEQGYALVLPPVLQVPSLAIAVPGQPTAAALAISGPDVAERLEAAIADLRQAAASIPAVPG